MTDLKVWDIVTGTFRPKRVDNLKPSALEHVGKTLQWEVYWIIEDGPYEGQWALVPLDDLTPWLGWVAEEDVEIHERS